MKITYVSYSTEIRNGRRDRPERIMSMEITDREIVLICIALDRYATGEVIKASETDNETFKNMHLKRSKELRDLISKLIKM